MQSIAIESIIAQEKRRDLLHQAAQERLIGLAKAGRSSSVTAGRWAEVRASLRIAWHRAQVLYR